MEVTQNENGSFTVEWDKKDPDWKFLNQFTSVQIVFQTQRSVVT